MNLLCYNIAQRWIITNILPTFNMKFQLKDKKEKKKDCIFIMAWLTRRLQPVTPARDMAMAVLERESSPKWPTIITDITCRRYCDRVTATIGPAKYPTLFISSPITLHPLLSSPSLSLSSTLCSKPSSMCACVCFKLQLWSVCIVCCL